MTGPVTARVDGPPARPAGPPRIPETLARRYSVEGVLGRGGMAIVLLARDLRLDREVALKLMGGPGSPSAPDDFAAEGKLLAALEHENVVRLYDAGVADGTGFLVMEYVRGQTLQARLAEGRPTLVEAVRITSHALRGVAFAHEKGIVHRDLKPGNIFIDVSGKARIADLGVAFRFRGDGAGAGARHDVAGTPAYMAPEQASGAGSGPAADVYAMGLVLHEMLTGYPVVATPTPITGKLVAPPPPPPPSRLNPTVPRPLDEVVASALARDPAGRPTARAFAAALDGWLDRACRRRAESGAGHPAQPYKPLEPFTADDATIFFGRDSETTELIEAIESPSIRLVLVFGPCGIGKSSLLRAGVLPKLDPDRFRAQLLLGGADPARAVREAIAALATLHAKDAAGPAPMTADDLRTDRLALADAVARTGRSLDRTLVLVLDQVEEVFTLNPRRAPPIADFFAIVGHLVAAQALPIKLVLAYRTEFRGEMFPLEERLARLQRSFSLRETSAGTLAEAVEGPALTGAYGFDYEEGFPLRLARDILATTRSRGDTALPVMQIVCHQLYQRARETGQTRVGPTLYEAAVGGVEGALQRYVEQRLESDAYAGHRDLARQIIRALTTREQAQDRFSRPLDEDELLSFPDREAARITLEKLLADHLLLRETTESGSRRIRLTSEVLCALVDRWALEPDETERAARILARAFRQWCENGRRPEDLLAGGTLRLVARCLGSLRSLSDEERAFVAASVTVARRRLMASILASFVVVVLVSALVHAAFFRPGRLLLDSSPSGARVLLGQRPLGTTPLATELPPGVYQLTLTRERHDPTPVTVKISSGGETRCSQVLAYPFGLLSVSSDPPDARCRIFAALVPPGGVGPARPGPRTERTPVAVAATPVTTELPRGTYALVLSREGYVTTDVGPIVLEPNRSLRAVTARLQPDSGGLTIRSPHEGVVMRVRDPRNGRDLQRVTVPTPGPLRLPPGSYALNWSKPGHASDVRLATVRRGVTTEVTAWTPPLDVLWRVQRDVEPRSSPSAADLDGDGTLDVVVAARDGVVRAFSGASGSPLGSFSTGPSPAVTDSTLPGSSPAIADLDGDGYPDVVIGDPAGRLTAHSLRRNQDLWVFQARGSIRSTPALADLEGDGTLRVVIGSDDGKLTCLSGKDGAVRWAVDAGGPVRSTAALAALTRDARPDVVVGVDGVGVVALDGRTGKRLWLHALPGGCRSSPALGDLDRDGVPDAAVGTPDGNVLPLDGRSGGALFYTVGAPILAPIELADLDGDGGLEVIAGAQDGFVRVAAVGRGTVWNQMVDGPITGVCARADLDGDGRPDLVVGTTAGTVHAIRGSTGAILWSLRTGGAVVGTPLVADLLHDAMPRVVVCSRDGVVQAVSATALPTRWAYDSGVPQVLTPAFADLDGDGLEDPVVMEDTGRLSAVSGDTGEPLWSADVRNLNSMPVLCGAGAHTLPELCVLAGRRVLAFAAVNGRERTALDTHLDDFHLMTPEVRSARGELFALSRQGEIAKISLAEGRVAWKARPGGVLALPVITDLDGDGQDDVVCADNEQRAFVVSGATGRIALEMTVSGPTYARPAVGDLDRDGRADIVVAPNSGRIEAFGGRTGKRLWSHDTGGPWLPGMVTTDLDGDGGADLVAALRNGEVLALSGRGSVLWRGRTPGNVGTRPVLHDLDGDGTPDPLVQTVDGHLQAFSGRSGEPLLKIPFRSQSISFIGLTRGVRRPGASAPGALAATQARPASPPRPGLIAVHGKTTLVRTTLLTSSREASQPRAVSFSHARVSDPARSLSRASR